MVLSLFALGAEITPAVKESQVAIENAFKQILDEQYTFRNFTNENVFMTELSTAVATDSIIVACAEPTYYKAFKNFVCNAFQLKCKPTKTISGLIEFVHPELSDDFIAEQSSIPTSAVPLPTQDGLYSGFGIKAKKQLLIVLPLDDKRIDYVINNSLFTFVRENMDMSVLTADPLSGMAENDSSLSKKSTRKDGQLYDALFIKACAKKLKSKGLTVALANTKTVDFISNISTSAVDLSKVVYVSAYTIEKGEMSAREYAINLAKGALATSANNVGGAITKVFAMPDENGVQQYFMYACIADTESANVAKLTAEPGETPPQLIYRAVEELFRMLNAWADTGYAMPQYADVAVVRPTATAKADPCLGKMKILVGALIGAGSVISLILSFVVNNIYGVM